MFRSSRSFLALVAFVLVAVAIFGYTAGYRRAPVSTPTVAHRETTRTISNAGVLLEYPAGWQPTKAAPAICPGYRSPILCSLAPSGDYARAGLLSGQLPAAEPSPLPTGFLALLRGVPHTEVVNLIDGQAFRYSRWRSPAMTGAGSLRDPLRGQHPDGLACYATQTAVSTYLSQCEQIVAGSRR